MCLFYFQKIGRRPFTNLIQRYTSVFNAIFISLEIGEWGSKRVNQSWETPPHDATHSPPTNPLPYWDPFNRGDVLQNKQIGAPHIPEVLSSLFLIPPLQWINTVAQCEYHIIHLTPTFSKSGENLILEESIQALWQNCLFDLFWREE